MRSLWNRYPGKDHETRYLSILDLGAWSVKALVVQRDGGEVAILGRGRGSMQHAGLSTMGERAPRELRADIDALAAACEEALRQAEDATEAVCGHKVVPDLVLLSVPTAWLRGAVGSGRAQRVALETGIALDECYEVVLRAGRRAIRNVGRVTGPGSWELLDGTLVTFSIDGHGVTDPIGFRGHLLEAIVSVVAAPSRLLGVLRQLADMLQLEPSGLVPEPLALSAACPGEGLIIEVGALSTGLCLTRYGAPLFFGSVGQGGADITRSLADAFKLSPSRAEALKQAYSAGRLTEEGMEAVLKVMEAPLGAWLSAVIEYLRSWGTALPAWPPDIYVCGGASELGEFHDWILSARWLDVLPFPHTPKTWTWDGSNLSQVLDHTGRRWQTDGIVALTLAAWAVRDRGSETPDGMLRTSLGMD